MVFTELNDYQNMVSFQLEVNYEHTQIKMCTHYIHVQRLPQNIFKQINKQISRNKNVPVRQKVKNWLKWIPNIRIISQKLDLQRSSIHGWFGYSSFYMPFI